MKCFILFLSIFLCFNFVLTIEDDLEEDEDIDNQLLLNLSGSENLPDDELDESIKNLENLRLNNSGPEIIAMDNIKNFLWELKGKLKPMKQWSVKSDKKETNEDLINMATNMYNEIKHIEEEIFKYLSKLKEKSDLSSISEKFLYEKTKINFALFKKELDILNKIILRISYPQKLINILDKTYNKVSQALFTILSNLWLRRKAEIQCGLLDATEEDYNKTVKFSEIRIEIQQLRFDEFKDILSKNLKSDNKIKSLIRKDLKSFENELNLYLAVFTDLLENEPLITAQDVKNLKYYNKVVKHLLLNVGKLLTILQVEPDEYAD